MKITLEIPDGTLCAFFSFVYGSGASMYMQAHSLDGRDLYDGAEIKIEEKHKNE